MAVVLDLSHRRVVGAAIGKKPNAQLVVDALQEALETVVFPPKIDRAFN